MGNKVCGQGFKPAFGEVLRETEKYIKNPDSDRLFDDIPALR
jgi:hypothetical protein